MRKGFNNLSLAARTSQAVPGCGRVAATETIGCVGVLVDAMIVPEAPLAVQVLLGRAAHSREATSVVTLLTNLAAIRCWLWRWRVRCLPLRNDTNDRFDEEKAETGKEITAVNTNLLLRNHISDSSSTVIGRQDSIKILLGKRHPLLATGCRAACDGSDDALCFCQCKASHRRANDVHLGNTIREDETSPFGQCSLAVLQLGVDTRNAREEIVRVPCSDIDFTAGCSRSNTFGVHFSIEATDGLIAAHTHRTRRTGMTGVLLACTNTVLWSAITVHTCFVARRA